jgi:uncharacterized membrane protein YccC
MSALTPQAKEAIKTALAMTIAYGVALSMDWPNPNWAGFAVAFISLSTVGQSLNKGLMRMAGTLLAAAFSLTLIALFLRERWSFFPMLSSLVGLCTYLMGRGRHPYFWNVDGCVSLIVCMRSAPATENAFNVTVVRILETGLGCRQESAHGCPKRLGRLATKAQIALQLRACHSSRVQERNPTHSVDLTFHVYPSSRGLMV